MVLIMEDFDTLLDGLKDKRLDYVMARSETNSMNSALEKAGISKSAFYKWDESERIMLDDRAARLRRATAAKAKMILQGALEKAAKVKAEGLDSRNEHVKQNTATEILDRGLGKPTASVEVSGKGGDPLKIIVEYANSQNNFAPIPSEPTERT